MHDDIRVLHVDDQPEFSAMAAEFLHQVDDRIDIVREPDASAGLERLEAESIDCVVSDYDMPTIDGLAFLERVREQYGDLPFILFTGKGTEAVASEAVSAGATDYFQKKSGTDQYQVLGHRIVNAVEQYRATRALDDNKQRFRTLVERSTDAIFIVGVDGTFEYVTPAVERVLGYQPEDLIGVNGFEAIHPDDTERVQSAFAELVGDPERTASVKYRYRHAKGHWVWIEARGRNLLDDDLIGGVVVYARDVTDRNRRKQQLERHERILETLGDAVYALNDEGRIIEVNEQAEQLTGYGREELLGTHISRYVSDVGVEEGNRIIRELLAFDDQQVGSFEGTITTADGDSIECSVRMTLLYSDDGEFVGSAGVVRNISEERRHDRRLERLRQRSQALMYTETHEETARAATIAADEVIGAPLSGVHLLNDDGNALEPIAVVDQVHQAFDEVPRYRKGAKSGTRAALAWGVFESGEPKRIDDVSEYPGLTEDTPARSVIVHPIGTHGVFIVSSAVPHAFDDTDEALVEILASSLTSAMDRVDREERLRDREHRLERLHNATVQLMEAKTPEEIADRAVTAGEDILEFPIVLVRLYDEERGGLVPVAQNESLNDVLPERSVYTQEGTSLNWEAFESGELKRYENVAEIDRAVDSETDLGSLLVVPLGEYGTFAAGETETGAFDETDVFLARILARETEAALQRAEREVELRIKQDELERQNDRLNEFASIVSHDLRNPLNVAEGRIELAREECESEHLAPIETALDRMNQIIERTLTLAREGQVVGETEEVDLASLIAQSWATIDQAEATIEFEDPPKILADQARLPHLFENLFRNAIEHGGRTVRIEVGRLPDGIYVQDDGYGIPEEDQDRVLEVGYSTTEGGTGLGLGIVREIANAHGWTLTVTESPSGGARFEITGITVIDED